MSYFSNPEAFLAEATIRGRYQIGNYPVEEYDFGGFRFDDQIYGYAVVAFDVGHNKPLISVLSKRCQLVLRSGGPISPTPDLFVYEHRQDGEVQNPGASEDCKDLQKFTARAREILLEKLERLGAGKAQETSDKTAAHRPWWKFWG